MAIRDQISEEQWKAIFSAPVAAAVYVATASGGGLDLVKELFSLSSFIRPRKPGVLSEYGALVDEVVAEIQAQSRSLLNSPQEGASPYAARAAALDIVRAAGEAVRGLPGEAGYQSWLMEAARHVAQASRRGFLGLGRKENAIDYAEQEALDELEAALTADG